MGARVCPCVNVFASVRVCVCVCEGLRICTEWDDDICSQEREREAHQCCDVMAYIFVTWSELRQIVTA